MGKRKRNRKYEHDDSQPPAKKQYFPSSPMPDGVHHYQTLEQVPWDIQKYVDDI